MQINQINQINQIKQTHSFSALHFNHQALLLINVWDAASAAIMAQHGATAIATSSASLAWSNGYADGGQLPTALFLQSIQNILRVIDLPLSVDIEDGFSDSPQQVADLVADLVDMGVAGINIEDGRFSPRLLSKKLQAIRKRLGKTPLFINARADVYLQTRVDEDSRMVETIQRAQHYLAHGADGIFVPGLVNSHEITQIAQSIQAPLNIMLSSEQDCVAHFIDAGAKRISLGPSSFITAYDSLRTKNHLDSKTKYNAELTYQGMNELF